MTLPPIRLPPPEKEPLLLLLPLLHPKRKPHTHSKGEKVLFPFLISSESPPKSTCTTTGLGVKGKAVGRDYQRGIISLFSRIVSSFAWWQCATFLMDRQTHRSIQGNGEGDGECVRIRISIDFPTLPSTFSFLYSLDFSIVVDGHFDRALDWTGDCRFIFVLLIHFFFVNQLALVFFNVFRINLRHLGTVFSSARRRVGCVAAVDFRSLRRRRRPVKQRRRTRHFRFRLGVRPLVVDGRMRFIRTHSPQVLADDFEFVQLDAQDADLLFQEISAKPPSSRIAVHFAAAIDSRLAHNLTVELSIAVVQLRCTATLATRLQSSNGRRGHRDRKGACGFRAAGNVSRLRKSLKIQLN